MARKIRMIDADADKYGIRIIHEDGKVGWIVGPDCDYLLFDDMASAEKALRSMKRDKRYSWNCVAEAAKFSK